MSKKKPVPGGADTSTPAQQKRNLWHMGALFHCTSRFPRKAKAPRVDRLAGILQRGLLAPAQCSAGLVCSDLSIQVTGISVPYDGLVFLHRYGEQSYIYTICDPGRFAVFVDPAHPVITQEDMGDAWPVLCQDEVYVRDSVPCEHFRAIAIHPADAEGVISELADDLRRLAIPLCDYAGNILWPR